MNEVNQDEVTHPYPQGSSKVMSQGEVTHSITQKTSKLPSEDMSTDLKPQRSVIEVLGEAQHKLNSSNRLGDRSASVKSVKSKTISVKSKAKAKLAKSSSKPSVAAKLNITHACQDIRTFMRRKVNGKSDT